MKILHIIPTYWPAFSKGGPIWSVHFLNKELVKRGVDVAVYTTNIGTSDVQNIGINTRTSDVQKVDGVSVRYFPVSFKKWEYSREMHKAIAKNIKDFDLVHITSVFLSASTLGAYYAKKNKKPYIISPRGALMKAPLKKKNYLLKALYIAAIEKRNLNGASAVHFTTELEKEEYVNLGLPVKKSVVIPNGLEIKKPAAIMPHSGEFLRQFGIPEDAKIILIFGRISWEKGFDTLIPAFAEVLTKESKATLVIVGGDDEGYKDKIIRLAESNNLKLGKDIIFTGQLLGKEKEFAYITADVFVLPSYAENFAMSAVEAMSYGLPVVVTNGVGIASDIKKAGAGIVIRKDKEELASAILKILNNPNLAEKMGGNGKKLVSEVFDIKNVANEWVKEYKRIIGMGTLDRNSKSQILNSK